MWTHTVWKLHDFCLIQFLRESNFEEFWSAKPAILNNTSRGRTVFLKTIGLNTSKWICLFTFKPPSWIVSRCTYMSFIDKWTKEQFYWDLHQIQSWNTLKAGPLSFVILDFGQTTSQNLWKFTSFLHFSWWI